MIKLSSGLTPATAQFSMDSSFEFSINLPKGLSVGTYGTINNGGALGVFANKGNGNVSNTSYIGVKPASAIGAGLIYAGTRLLPPLVSPSLGSGVINMPNSKTYY